MTTAYRLLGDALRGRRVVMRKSARDAERDLPPGTEGEILSVDDAGTIFVKWDTGRNLGIVEEDRWELLPVEPKPPLPGADPLDPALPRDVAIDMLRSLAVEADHEAELAYADAARMQQVRPHAAAILAQTAWMRYRDAMHQQALDLMLEHLRSIAISLDGQRSL
jgi:hypothetical protein